MDWLFPFPENISTFGARIDGLFWVVTVITGIVFVGVEVALVAFMIKYRHRPGRKAEHVPGPGKHTAHHVHGHFGLEMLWTLGTAIIVIILAIVSRPLWLEIKDPNRFPDPGLELRIAAKQFEWNVTYPGADGQIDTADDFVVRNQLHVPANTPVQFQLMAEDVIHSFYVPQLRLKQDAVPGMQIPVWFEATTPGDYVLGCAELCGLGHYRMQGTMTVHAQADFDAWQATQVAAIEAGAPGAPVLASTLGENSGQSSGMEQQ